MPGRIPCPPGCDCEKHRRNLSGANNPFFGRRHTEETKEKNRAAHIGKRYAAGPHNVSEVGRAQLSANGKARSGIPITHGHAVGTVTPTYKSWKAMVQRCTDPNKSNYQYYGERGIKVCEQWLGRGGFDRFLADVGERPGADYQIGRIDNDGNYEPGNVEWITKAANIAEKNQRAAKKR